MSAGVVIYIWMKWAFNDPNVIHNSRCSSLSSMCIINYMDIYISVRFQKNQKSFVKIPCTHIDCLLPVKCVGGDYCIWHTEWSRFVFKIVIYGRKLQILLYECIYLNQIKEEIQCTFGIEKRFWNLINEFQSDELLHWIRFGIRILEMIAQLWNVSHSFTQYLISIN